MLINNITTAVEFPTKTFFAVYLHFSCIEMFRRECFLLILASAQKMIVWLETSCSTPFN